MGGDFALIDYASEAMRRDRPAITAQLLARRDLRRFDEPRFIRVLGLPMPWAARGWMARMPPPQGVNPRGSHGRPVDL